MLFLTLTGLCRIEPSRDHHYLRFHCLRLVPINTVELGI